MKLRAHRWRFRWGLVLAFAYLLVAVPCAAVYLADRHEHCIPMYIVYFLSFPVHFLLFDVLRPQTIFIERLPCGETVAISVWLALTAAFYFVVGQSLAGIARSVRRCLMLCRAPRRKERSI